MGGTCSAHNTLMHAHTLLWCRCDIASQAGHGAIVISNLSCFCSIAAANACQTPWLAHHAVCRSSGGYRMSQWVPTHHLSKQTLPSVQLPAAASFSASRPTLDLQAHANTSGAYSAPSSPHSIASHRPVPRASVHLMCLHSRVMAPPFYRLTAAPVSV